MVFSFHLLFVVFVYNVERLIEVLKPGALTPSQDVLLAAVDTNAAPTFGPEIELPDDIPTADTAVIHHALLLPEGAWPVLSQAKVSL